MGFFLNLIFTGQNVLYTAIVHLYVYKQDGQDLDGISFFPFNFLTVDAG